MLFNILLHFLVYTLISAIIVGLVKIGIELPRFVKHRREVRRAEREKTRELEAFLHNLLVEQKEWFDRAYEKPPWRPLHRAG